MSAVAPRSLADDLRARSDDALTALLRGRPDLLLPTPRDMHALATRATSGPSLARCLDGLDALTLHMLAVAAACTAHAPASQEAILDAGAVKAQPDVRDADVRDADVREACERALQRCHELALLWGTPDELHTVHALPDLLRPLEIAPWPSPLAAGASPANESSRSSSSSRSPFALDQVDSGAAMHALEFVVGVRDILDDWSIDPPAILRTGGLALRDLAAAGRILHRSPAESATVIEVAHATGLVIDDQDAPAHWVPTDSYDQWQSLPRPDQWLTLVHAWLDLPRLPSLADERTQILVDSKDRRVIPRIRRAALQAWAAQGAGHVPRQGDLMAILDYAEPRRAGELRAMTVAATLREAEQLGLAAGGVLSTAARLLLDDSLDPATADAHARAELQRTLPHEIDHVLIQADLTIVAPGPLDIEVARRLRVIADVESRGHATVYRVTEQSLTRAFDSGWDADAVEGLLAGAATTAVPQPLSYLIHDTARRHGAIRVGNALGYLRCDNTDTVTAALHDKRLAKLSLSRLADTVLVSPFPATDLIAALRAAGYSPAAEGSDGRMLIHRPADRRVRAPKPTATATANRDEGRLVAAALRALRAGEQARSSRSAASMVAGPAGTGAPASLSTTAVSGTIKKAVLDHAPLWLGYAEIDGTVTEQLVDPIRLSAGTLTAFDHRTDTVRTFAIARVTGVAAPSA